MTPKTSARAMPEWLAYSLLGLATLGYAAATIFTPLTPRANTYGLTIAQIRGLQLSLVLPIIAVWFIALWGSLRFKRYALSIYQGADGRALNSIANGLLVLVAELATGSLLQACSRFLLHWASAATITITTNYIAVGLSLISFGLIYRGAWRLVKLVQFRGFRRNQLVALVLLAAIGILYGWLLAHNPDRLHSLDPGKIVPYYLPDWLLLLTIVLPYIMVWGFGLIAAVAIRSYQHYAVGILYRKPLARLSVGLAAIILSLILLQLITALGPSLVRLGLEPILALLYALILVYAVGHVLVALGARRLAKIEEVH
jgi:hypothetical protein